MRLLSPLARLLMRPMLPLWVTTPTSYYSRLTGQEAFTDALSFPAGTKIGGLTMDDTNRLVAVPAANTTLTLTAAAHSGKILLIASTGGLAVTPPAATGSGSIYTFVVTATLTGGSFTFDAKAGQASDLINGTAMQFKSGTGVTFYSASTNTNLITLNGTTTGGIIGDVLELIDVATHQWIVFLWSQATGTVASPFSNH